MRRITQTLAILRRVDGGVDRYGNPTVSWERVEWPVFAVAPRTSDEPDRANRDAVVTGIQVHAPIDDPKPGPHDRIEHFGAEWQVVGQVAAWDKNPHVTTTCHRGIVVNLERVEG